MKKNPRVEIRIDELFLDGFNPGDRYLIADAFSQELQQLVADNGPGHLAQIESRSAVRAEDLTLSPGMNARAVGTQVARTIHASLETKGS